MTFRTRGKTWPYWRNRALHDRCLRRLAAHCPCAGQPFGIVARPVRAADNSERGALIEARQRGLLPDAVQLADELRNSAGFWISKELYDLLTG